MANIMIIDDQPFFGELLLEDLSDGVHTISWVVDTDDTIANIRTFMPDIVLLDLYLRGFEGWDLLHRIKMEDPSIPVLIVTAYDTFLGDPRLVEADGYMIKDIYTDKLKQKINEVLINHAQKSQRK